LQEREFPSAAYLGTVDYPLRAGKQLNIIAACRRVAGKLQSDLALIPLHIAIRIVRGRPQEKDRTHRGAQVTTRRRIYRHHHDAEADHIELIGECTTVVGIQSANGHLNRVAGAVGSLIRSYGNGHLLSICHSGYRG